jgi:hypothetical protein
MNEAVLVTADWVERHAEEFKRDDPTYRPLEVNDPELTEDEHTVYETAPVRRFSTGTGISPTEHADISSTMKGLPRSTGSCFGTR